MSNVPDRQAMPWDMLNPTIDKVNDTVYLNRLEICKACPQLLKPINMCKQCGCIMNAKAKLPHAYCPLGKWKQESSENHG